MPYHPGRQAGLVFLLPPRLLGKSDGPIKNLLPISITQGEHPPHLGEPGLTQGTPVPLVGASPSGANPTDPPPPWDPPEAPATATDPPPDHPQHHTQPAPPHPAASHPDATTKQNRHEPHYPPCTNPTTPPTASRGIHPKKRDPQRHTRTNPADTTLSVAPALLPHRGDFVRDGVSCYLDFAWVIPKAPWNAGRDKEDSTLSRYPRP